MGAAFVRRELRGDGSIVLRSSEELEPYPRCLTERLRLWATQAPERVFLAQRGHDGTWERWNYRDSLARVCSIAQALLDRGLSASRPVAILSENDLDQAFLTLAAMHVGVPVVPVSPAYSLVSRDFVRLKSIVESVQPKLVFASDGSIYRAALEALAAPGREFLVRHNASQGVGASGFEDLLRRDATAEVECRHADVIPETIAKILFTSGSTSAPKGVPNTHRMLCANQQQLLQAYPFFAEEPPVLVDWLPWHHTFGSNHNLGIALYNGGSFYIDEGRPASTRIEATFVNLREISPTVYFNVPRGFEELIARCESDGELCASLLRRVRMFFCAGAGLSRQAWERLDRLAVETCGERIAICSGLGCTESAPCALLLSRPGGAAGMLGTPVPGLELKLAPLGDRYEARYRGPNIMQAYWNRPDSRDDSFDEESFFCSGDAVRFVDPQDSDLGLLFDGRISEDFKLSSGTWVNVGALRSAAIGAFAPLVRDAVLTGLDRDWVGAILFVDESACRACAEMPDESPLEAVLLAPKLRMRFQDDLDRLARNASGGARRIRRICLEARPPALDDGELTDKGSVNQGTVLRLRAATVEYLYREPAPSDVLVAR